MGLLTGKTAVITGGSSGIGLATAQRFLAEGAHHVVISGRRQTELDAAVAALGERATGVQGDASVLADLDRLYQVVSDRHMGLDIVVANAGFAQVATIDDITEEHLDTLFATNVKGVVFTVQKALPLLNDGASVILTGSVTGERGRAGIGAYAASKAAIRSFGRTWANELASRNVRVNVIVAGSTATPGSDALAEQTDPETPITEFRAGRIAGIPLGRFAEPTEIANTAVFLASDLASFTTGAAIAADGGANQV